MCGKKHATAAPMWLASPLATRTLVGTRLVKDGVAKLCGSRRGKMVWIYCVGQDVLIPRKDGVDLLCGSR